ncbi:MAG: cytochrome c biogenesis CcdA family protein [Pikeienuella sp.]
MIEFVYAYLGGLISFLSPCVLPLVPPYLAFMAGTTIDQISDENTADRALERRVLISSVFFVLGLATVFVALGAGASVIGQTLLQNKILFGQIAGGVIIIMGIHFLGIIRIPFLYREARFDAGKSAGNYAGAYVIGLAFAFGWTPCIGPILGSILVLAGQEETIGRGVLMLAIYAAGLGLPFILAAFFVRPFMNWMRGFRKHMGLVEKLMGGLLVLVGVAMITGTFSAAAFWLIETFPFLATIG